MTQESEIKELKKLLDEIISVPTKNDAKRAIMRFESLLASISNKLDSYQREKLIQAICYAKEASGSVDNKQNNIRAMENAWSVFESRVKIS